MRRRLSIIPSGQPIRSARRSLVYALCSHMIPTLWVGLVSLLFLYACGGEMIRRIDAPPPPPPKMGYLELKGLDPQVRIYIDDRYRGHIGDYPLKTLLLRTGTRRMKLTHQRFSTLYTLVKISPRRPLSLTLNMIALPPPPPSPQGI